MEKFKHLILLNIELIMGWLSGTLLYMKINPEWFLEIIGSVIAAILITIVVFFLKRFLNKKFPEVNNKYKNK